MKTVQTKSGNFVLVTSDKHEIPISRPYLNYCNYSRRLEKELDYSQLESLKEYYKSTFENGMFEGYDYGHDIGIDDPFAQEILNSNVLLVN